MKVDDFFLGKMWMHEHFNLREAPDLVTYSKKMLAGGIYHKVMHKTVPQHSGGFCNGCIT
jgi:4-aminobutyrate aminotransferase-like enzyme